MYYVKMFLSLNSSWNSYTHEWFMNIISCANSTTRFLQRVCIMKNVPYSATCTSWRLMNFFVFAHYKSSKIVCITHLFYWFVAIQFDKSYWKQRIFLSVLVMLFHLKRHRITRKPVRLVNCNSSKHQSKAFTVQWMLWVLPSKTYIYLTLYLTLPHFFSQTTSHVLIIVLFMWNAFFEEF